MGFGEDDGPGGRTTGALVVEEKVREDSLRGLGLEVVRWDTPQIRHHSLEVARRIELARNRGDLGRFTGRLREGDRWLDPSEHLDGTVLTSPGVPETVPRRCSVEGGLRRGGGR
jgi:hypothetical protein